MSQGIFGLIDFGRHIDNPGEVAATMAQFLEKSGSRKAEISYIWDKHYVFGMKRICENSYQQTFIARNEDLQLLCLIHGEIYNYQDLLLECFAGDIFCQGDLDLALHLYRLYGPRFAKELNGFFSLAILDQRNDSFILLNDRFGMAHQVYWATVSGRFCFATHLKTLLAYPEIRREIDHEALNLFLKYSYIPSPWTILKGIKKLRPGHSLVFKNGKVSEQSYWEFGQGMRGIKDPQEAIIAYKRLLKEAVSRRIGSDGSVGILLSGGLDSSSNVALAAQCTEKKLKTFSVGFADPTFDERPYARIVARHFDTEHFEYTINGQEIELLPKLVWYLEEPYFEFGLFLTYLGMAAAKKEVDIVLGGEGADQLFGTGGFAGGLPVALRYLLLKYYLHRPGALTTRLLRGNYFYEHDNLAFKLRLLWNRAINLNNWYFYGYDEHELSLLHRNPALASLPKIFPNQSASRPSSFAALYRETQVNQDLKHYVNENVMVKSGRMADMMDLTLRESYLDTQVTDFLVSLDYRLKRSGDVLNHLKGNIKTKFLHRKAMEDLLPPEIMLKPKQGGFVPVMIFLKKPEIRKRIYRYLLSSEVMKEYFNLDYLNTMFSNYERIQGRKIYWHNFYNSKANRILFLLTFDMWHHFYVKNNPLDVIPCRLSDYIISEDRT
ncbi:MAG: asparagine synthetase B family protein [Candidatus Hodarchaeota archaeon]